MRRLSALVLFAVAASGCSAVSDFGFTFGDAGAADTGSSDGGGLDMPRPPTDGGTDSGPTDGGLDFSFDAGVPCATACDDGDPCNGVEVCDTTVGACVPGTPVTCAPIDVCHMAGTCDMATGACVDGAVIDVNDGDLCNGAETCSVVGGVMTIVPGAPRCDDGVACTLDTCDPTTGGCTSVPKDTSCSGATEICRVTAASCTTTTCAATSDCTGTQICYGGFCCAAATGGCVTVSCTTDAGCSDGIACNGTETCDLSTHTCGSGTPVDCSDGLACSIDSCIEGAGGTSHTCRHTPGDADGDTYASRTCVSGMGDDCNDSDPAIFPGATESCNGVDDNCNGAIDETFAGLGTNCTAGLGVCTMNGMIVCNAMHNGAMCNASPGMGGATELCGNGVDDNCNGMVDEGYAMVGTTCTVGVGACTHSGTYVCGMDLVSVVCNTGAGSPGNELCGNGIDDNCNGMVDEGFPLLGMACSAGIGACLRTGAYTCSADRLSQVCSATAGSAMPEVCNGIDDDCNGLIDDGVTVTYYRDGDGDGYGVGTPMTGCIPSTGYATRNGDCNDGDNSVNPGAAEICGNMLDDNCNGLIDDLCPPANDHCAAQTPLGTIRPNMGGMLPTQTIDYATIDSADCMATTGTRSSGPDVFYGFDTSPGSYPYLIYFDTLGANFDTMISVRDSCGTAPALCADDSCGTTQTQAVFVVPPSAAARHFVLTVHAFLSSVPVGSSFPLHWQALPGASGTIQPLPAVGSVLTVAMPTDPGAMSSSSCAPVVNTATGGHGEDLFWMLGCPTITHVLQADTCSTSPFYNSVMYVRGSGGGADLACNDDGGVGCMPLSSVNASIAGAGIFGLWVDRGNMIMPPPPPPTYTLRVTSF